MSRKFDIYFGHFALLFFLVLQISFLDADPHPSISTSRGPFTDEGLNTFQARNFVNHGYWGVSEGDNLIKSPLFNGVLISLLPASPDSRTTLRFSLLLLCSMLWYCAALLFRSFAFGAFFLIAGGLQYHLFQFYHFTMTELLVISLSLCSLGFGYRFLTQGEEHSPKNLILSLVMAYLAFLLKIQYAYLLLLPVMIWLVASFSKSYRLHFRHVRQLGWLLSFLLLGGILFYLCWYLPLQETFDRVWSHQGGNRFTGLQNAWETFSNSGKYLLWNPQNLWFAWAFLLSFPLGLMILGRSKSQPVKALLILGLCWMLLELHKPFILYLPSRYALSLFAAQAFWMSACLYGGIHYMKQEWKWRLNTYLKPLAFAFILPLLWGHYLNLRMLWMEQTNYSAQIIEKYNGSDLKGKAAVGVWATGLVWNCDAYVLPVWKNFMNDEDILEKHKPSIVVAERGELDSEGVFKDRGIELQAIADSSLSYQYGSYDLDFFFLSY